MNRMNNEFALLERMKSDASAFQQSPHRIEEEDQHPNDNVFDLKNLSVYLADQSIDQFDQQLSQLQLNESTNAHDRPMVTSTPTLKRKASSSRFKYNVPSKRRLAPSDSAIDPTICANHDKAESERMTMVDDPVKLLRLKLQQVVDEHKSNYTMAIEAAANQFQAEHPELSPIIVYSISKGSFFYQLQKCLNIFWFQNLNFLVVYGIQLRKNHHYEPNRMEIAKEHNSGKSIEFAKFKFSMRISHNTFYCHFDFQTP